MLYQVLVKYCTVFQALRWLTTVYITSALMDHYHHAISGVGKILHCMLLLLLLLLLLVIIRSNWNLEVLVVMEQGKPEKHPWSKARTNNKLTPHVMANTRIEPGSQRREGSAYPLRQPCSPQIPHNESLTPSTLDFPLVEQ